MKGKRDEYSSRVGQGFFVCVFFQMLEGTFFSYSYLTSLGFVGVFSFLFFSLSTASIVLLVM